jgi:hypothetical protein
MASPRAEASSKAVVEAVSSSRPWLEQHLFNAVAATLERVGMLRPGYALAFDVFLSTGACYFRIRGAVALLGGHGPRLRSRGVRDFRADLDAWRRCLLTSCGLWGLRSMSEPIGRDAVAVAFQDRWLHQLFDVPFSSLPGGPHVARCGATRGCRLVTGNSRVTAAGSFDPVDGGRDQVEPPAKTTAHRARKDRPV